MTPDKRREMIVQAALPLVAERGAAVTTQQVAKAAGIGEATIFRAFADKDELLNACLLAALRDDHVLAEVDAVPLDQPLAARLTEAAATLRAYLDRMGTVIGALRATGHHPERGMPAGDLGEAGAGRREAIERTHQAVSRLLEPDQGSLRLPADQLAGIFLGLLFRRGGMPGGPDVSMETLVDLFLHGVVAGPPGAAG
jgi:AcrR family transcriptional regulator